MFENCDNPNIVPPANTAKAVKRTSKSNKNSKALPKESTTGQTNQTTAAQTTSKGGKGKKVSAKSTSGAGKQSSASKQGGSSSSGSGKSSNKQWLQPKTEHGHKKGKKIPEKDPCGGEEKKSKEFKPRSIYPFNKVTQTESGHVMEIDDTPGSERISLFHRSGSNVEYFPNGDVLRQDVRDSYCHVFRDNYVHLGGYSSITVDKGLKILVNDDEEENTPEENVTFDIHIAGNANVNIYVQKGNMNVSMLEGDVNMRLNKGDVNILQDEGNYNHTVGGDYNLEVAGHMHVVVGGNVINEIGGNRDERIDGEFDQKNLTNSQSYLGEYLQGDKRTYVGGNKVIQVDKQINETCTNKVQKIDVKETYVKGLCSIKSDANIQLSSKVAFSIESLDFMVIRSAGSMDIFAAEDPKKKGKYRLYSGNTLELVATNYGALRSINSSIEIKSPTDVKTITRVLYMAEETDTAPKFTPEAKPLNEVHPYSYGLRTPEETQNFIKSNKKQWIPTNSKK